MNKFFFNLAPFLTLMVACTTFAVIPFANSISYNGEIISFQAADLNVGILYILAMTSLGVFGIMMAGWSSNNKFALLGGLRSSAQMFSYEISMGLAIISIVLMSGSLELNGIVIHQTELPWKWNFLLQPLACFIFITSAFAETNRTPFDLPEGEAEIVGYHVEYSSMKFAMFFMAEYANMIIASALIATLFFGGWQVPFLSTDFLRTHAEEALFILVLVHGILFMGIGGLVLSKYKKGRYGDRRDNETLVLGAPLLLVGLGISLFALFHGTFLLTENGRQIVTAFVQFGMFMGKLLFFCWLFIWVRWTLPRFRYDQLMHLGWKAMMPLSLINIVVTAVVMYFKK